MGLDNYVRLKLKNPLSQELFEKHKLTSWTYPGLDLADIEILYLRKCWGIRRNFLDTLPPSTYEYPLNIEDIYQLKSTFADFANEEYYNEYADSIWDYKEFMECYKERLDCLNFLIDYWKANPDEIESVTFVDSY